MRAGEVLGMSAGEERGSQGFCQLGTFVVKKDRFHLFVSGVFECDLAFLAVKDGIIKLFLVCLSGRFGIFRS